MLQDAKGKRLNPRTNESEEGIWYLMEENSQKVKYFVPFSDKMGQPHYLLQRLGTVPEGSTVVLEYKRREGSMRGYIDVRVDTSDLLEITTNEIPVIDSIGTTEIEDNIIDENEGNSTTPIPF